jgi:hypothetical protein
MTTIALHQFGTQVLVAAEDGGLWFRSPASSLAEASSWPEEALVADGARSVAFVLEQCVTTGLAEIEGNDVRVPYSSFSDLDELGWDLTSRWTQPCPFVLQIGRQGDVGRPDFRYEYQFIAGVRPVTAYERAGCFLRRPGSSTVYRLEPRMYQLVEAIDHFNGLPAERKAPDEAWRTFAGVAQLAASVRAILDDALSSNDVLVPSAIGLGLFEHHDGSLSFTPTCGAVDDKEFAKVFLHHTGEHGMYTVAGSDGRRIRLVLTERQQQALERMRTVCRVRGKRKQEVLENPAAPLDGYLDVVDLPYGDRVVGVGSFKFAPTPKPPDVGSMTDGLTPCEEPSPVPSGLPTHPEELADLRTAVDDARREGCTSITFQGREIRITAELIRRLNHGIIRPGSGDGKAPEEAAQPKPAGTFLLIYTDEQEILDRDRQAAELAREHPGTLLEFHRPEGLRRNVELKPHQEEGVRWLQTCVSQKERRGVLLADDMGLGKTLQILTFLAWCIESGKYPELSREVGPFRPILVIAPLVLIENDTWVREMQTFFAAHGSVFQPVLTLYGTRLHQLRREARADIDIGKPVLDIDELRRHRLVITNYETVTRYQHSFAVQPGGKPLWSVLVTDEAQEYKTPNSKISHAVKAIQPQFAIASTGTPVENRLLDLWNVFDALQPALLGSAREFTDIYEKYASEKLNDLKERLLFQRPHAFLLRRDKTGLAGLPAKHVVRLECEMSNAERDQHTQLVAEIRNGTEPRSALRSLHNLALFSQHPDLVVGSPDLGGTEWIRRSSKLARIIRTLHEVRRRGEKAIIFARHIAVQEMLADVCSSEFGIHVKVINGDSRRAGAGKESRAKMLASFREATGFGIIVLSPFVAGVGLTVTEANHVIHYGRWWNPAVESQATDRAYRIGQTKDVFVYLPILVDPQKAFVTFDEQLNALLERRQRLADDFLRPLDGTEDSMAEELIGSLRGQPTGAKQAVPVL